MVDETAGVRRLYPDQPQIAVSVAVFRQDSFGQDRVLLATRTKPPYAGAYSLPGGLVELGETLAEAALRELREEVGVAARILCFNRHIEAIDRDDANAVRHHYVIASFVAEWLDGEGTIGPEAGAILWASPDEIAGLYTTPNIAAVIGRARELRAARLA